MKKQFTIALLAAAFISTGAFAQDAAKTEASKKKTPNVATPQAVQATQAATIDVATPVKAEPVAPVTNSRGKVDASTATPQAVAPRKAGKSNHTVEQKPASATSK